MAWMDLVAAFQVRLQLKKKIIVVASFSRYRLGPAAVGYTWTSLGQIWLADDQVHLLAAGPGQRWLNPYSSPPYPMKAHFWDLESNFLLIF